MYSCLSFAKEIGKHTFLLIFSKQAQEGYI